MIWRCAAERDLLEIWRYTAREWDVDQADLYTEKLVRAVEWLCQNPDLGSWQLYRGSPYRRWTIGRHALIFRRDGKELRVVRVLHGAMNI